MRTETHEAPDVTYQDCWKMDDPHIFYAEASTLGLPPGKFPPFFNTDMGNGQPFQFFRTVNGILHYRQVFGCLTLRLFND